MEDYLFRLIATHLSCPVTWGRFPDGQGAPRATLQRLSVQHDRTLTGRGLSLAQVQLDIYAASFGAAKAESAAIAEVLDGHQGGDILLIALENERDGSDRDIGILSRISLTFSIRYRDPQAG